MSSDKPQQPAPKPGEPREVTPGGLEVRTPTRGEFFANLKKVTKPDPE
jgi:hypothetical protein